MFNNNNPPRNSMDRKSYEALIHRTDTKFTTTTTTTSTTTDVSNNYNMGCTISKEYAFILLNKSPLIPTAVLFLFTLDISAGTRICTFGYLFFPFTISMLCHLSNLHCPILSPVLDEMRMKSLMIFRLYNSFSSTILFV